MIEVVELGPTDGIGPWLVQLIVDPLVAIELEFFIGSSVKLGMVPEAWAPERDTVRLVLTSDLWADRGEADARSMAKDEVRRINESLEADSPLHVPVAVGTYSWRADAGAPDGFNRAATVELSPGTINITAGTMAVLINGYAIAPPRTRGLRARELEESDADFLRACRRFESAADDIRRLWVVFEYVRDRFNPKRPESLPGFSTTEIRSFCETADKRGLRHKSRGGPLTYPEMSGIEARKLMQRLLNHWLDADNAT